MQNQSALDMIEILLSDELKLRIKQNLNKALFTHFTKYCKPNKNHVERMSILEDLF